MTNFNVSIKNTTSVKKIIARILVHVFVRIEDIYKLLLMVQ